MPRKRKEEMTIEPGKGLNPELIKQLVPGTLERATINEQLAALKKAIFERAPACSVPSSRYAISATERDTSTPRFA
ncbi:putative transposase [Burkholderia pseudomallei]|uniref:Transposase n=1 Tax=Burkholderia pseudomallei TaxID=28450 RepID=A0AA40JJB4_BURPE|nr:putative transposase [Burkholderia pseudomallei]